jgi:Right handed beta helix region/Putative collagen-binding domain of a collagenase
MRNQQCRSQLTGALRQLHRARLPAVFVVLLLIESCSAAAGTTFHVNPQGADTWSGTLAAPNADRTDGPKASLAGAQAAVRTLKARGPLTEPVHVKVAGGLYVLSEPVTFTPADSGTPGNPVVYEAVPGEPPIFSGGRAITGIQARADGLWQVRIPDVANGRWSFEQLFVDGGRAVRARDPNLSLDPWADVRTSAARIKENLARSFHTIRTVSETDRGGGEFAHTITAAPGALDRLARVSPAQLKDVSVVVYHAWDTTRRFLGSLDLACHSLTVTGSRWAPWNPWKNQGLFHLENFRAALDAAGEWFLDHDGTLLYKPLPGEDPSRALLFAPRLDRLLIIKGEAAPQQFVENIQFKGLSFQHGQWLTPPGGVSPAQAASDVDAAIMVDHARDIVISHCEISHVGRFGIWFRRGCRDITLEHTLIQDLGAGGVRIGETQGAETASHTGAITVDNDIIRSGGRIFPGAAAILVGQSGDNVISHNDISDHYYTGISTGWTWGYAKNLAKNNRIEHNHIHHLGQGVLSDLGGFYSLGPSEGTTVFGNVVHDIYSTTYGGWGLYTDEGSTGVTLRNNLVYNTKTGGFHQHYGRDNVISNNIFAYGLQWQVQLTRPEAHRSFTFSNNLIYWTQGGLFSGPFDQAQALLEKNLYWDASSGRANFTLASLRWQGADAADTIAELSKHPRTDLAEWQHSRKDAGSVVADPLFVDPMRYDFRLKVGSPARQIGFAPFDYSKAGVYGEPAWIKQGAEPRPKGPLGQSKNPNYFADASGAPLVLCGSHTWNTLQDWGTGGGVRALDFDTFVAFLKDHKHNFTLLWTTELPRFRGLPSTEVSPPDFTVSPFPWMRTGPGLATDGGPKFDLTRFDQGYFDRLRARVRTLHEAGIYAGVYLFSGEFLLRFRFAADGYPFSGPNNVNKIDDAYRGGSAASAVSSVTMTAPNAITEFQDAYVRKVIDTLNDLPNVLWIVSEEAPINSTWWNDHLISLVRAYEKGKGAQHPIGYGTLEQPRDSILYNSDADWVAPWAWVSPTQSCGSGTPACKVNVNDSDHSYFGMWNDPPQKNRNYAWENFLNGNQVLFMDPYLVHYPRQKRNLCVTPVNGIGSKPDPRWENFRYNLGYIVQYSRKLNLANVTPKAALSSTKFCLAQTPSAGAEYLVYSPAGGPFTVDLSAMPTSRMLAVEWFNPATGATISRPPIAAGSRSQSMTPPFSGDAVLYLVDTSGHK